MASMVRGEDDGGIHAEAVAHVRRWSGLCALAVPVAAGVSVMAELRHGLVTSAVAFGVAYLAALHVYLLWRWGVLARFLNGNTVMDRGTHSQRVCALLREYRDLGRLQACTPSVLRFCVDTHAMVLAPVALWALQCNGEYARLVSDSPWMTGEPGWPERLFTSLLLMAMRAYFGGGDAAWRAVSTLCCAAALAMSHTNAHTVAVYHGLMGVQSGALVFFCKCLCGMSVIVVTTETVVLGCGVWVMPPRLWKGLWDSLEACGQHLCDTQE